VFTTSGTYPWSFVTQTFNGEIKCYGKRLLPSPVAFWCSSGSKIPPNTSLISAVKNQLDLVKI